MLGREVGRSVTVANTSNAAGNRGFAFYLWLIPADGGAPRPFSVYLVQEGARIVVANVRPDRPVEGIRPALPQELLGEAHAAQEDATAPPIPRPIPATLANGRLGVFHQQLLPFLPTSSPAIE